MYRQSLPYIVSLLLPLVAGQTVTAGPQPLERVSMAGNSAYILARSCVQHCLWDPGPAGLRGGVYNDWYDVGKELDCGGRPLNGCYCATAESSSATSIFSSYITYYCGKDTDPDNLVAALSIYNEYCATANGNPVKPVPAPVTVSATSTSSSVSETETESTSSSEENTEEASSTASSSEPSPLSASRTATGKEETNTPSTSGGLSQGTVIGIAVGASVGGILLIAVIVLSICLYRRKTRPPKETQMGGIQGY